MQTGLRCSVLADLLDGRSQLIVYHFMVGPGWEICTGKASSSATRRTRSFTLVRATLSGAHNWLDLTPKGRNEQSAMDWVRLHDEYEAAPASARCHETVEAAQ